MRCDVMAMGIIQAASETHLRIPMVIRLKGTRQEEAKKLLESSGLRLLPEDDLEAAAGKAVCPSLLCFLLFASLLSFPPFSFGHEDNVVVFVLVVVDSCCGLLVSLFCHALVAVVCSSC